jgi:hypothetical protein
MILICGRSYLRNFPPGASASCGCPRQWSTLQARTGFLFSVQPDNAFVPDAALLDIAGQQFVEVLQAGGVIRHFHAISRAGTY